MATTGFEALNGVFNSPFSNFSATAEPAPQPAEPQEGEIRTCRICLEQIPPPYTPDEELGRLISPCVCKGSSRFVHQGCLQQWRLSSANTTNFYQCPTCHYQYRFRRLKLAAVVGSSGMYPPPSLSSWGEFTYSPWIEPRPPIRHHIQHHDRRRVPPRLRLRAHN